ncbi:MAG: DUF554 domain-containing protein [Desulfovibrio sp.]|uniref:DUF554 domain-containing protein n=1 Tax=Desulfovibrio sp. TaxID=885 RepID=UPI0039E6432E
MIGPVINSACIVTGALVGTYFGDRMGEAFRKKLILVFGCINTGMGIFMIGKTQSLPPVVCALLVGSLIGELLRVEYAVTWLAHKAARLFSKVGTSSRAPLEFVQEQFSIFLVVFCASGLGFFGSMQEGISGDMSMLLIKSLLDLPTAMFIAANVGGVIGALAIPQFTIQAAVVLLAGFLSQYTTPSLISDFSGCGGFIMLATGLRTCGITQFPILSMLPSLFLIMPFSALWAHIFS